MTRTWHPGLPLASALFGILVAAASSALSAPAPGDVSAGQSSMRRSAGAATRWTPTASARCIGASSDAAPVSRPDLTTPPR